MKMSIKESVEVMRLGLVQQCMVMESVRKQLLAQVTNKHLPMQDHLAECSIGRNPEYDWSVAQCYRYLQSVGKALEKAAKHDELAEKRRLDSKSPVVQIADMLYGDIDHDFNGHLMACAEEVWKTVRRMADERIETGSRADKIWKNMVMEEIQAICTRHGVSFALNGEYNLPVGYMDEWIRNRYITCL